MFWVGVKGVTLRNTSGQGLPVPVLSQVTSHTCVPVALMMVIEYLNANKLVDPIAGLTVTEIAQVVKINRLGTDIENVRHLNKDPRVLAANPSVEFEARKVPRERTDIEADLKQGLPVIAWMVLGEGLRETCHAVVVTYLNPLTDEIAYIDPFDGEHVESLINFAPKWQRAERMLVRVILGRKSTQDLRQYGGRKP